MHSMPLLAAATVAVVLLLSLLPSWSSAATLVAYGAGAGDTTLFTNVDDNALSVTMPASPTMNLGGSPTSTVWVSTNGPIEFDHADSSFSKTSLTSFGQRMAVTLYKDLVSTVYYRFVSSSDGSFSTLWSSINTQVTSYVPASFTPTNLLIVTWTGNYYRPREAYPPFQTVLAWNAAGTTYAVQLLSSTSVSGLNGYCLTTASCVDTRSVMLSSGGAFAFKFSACAAGYYGDGICTACPAGTYNPNIDQENVTSCLPCAAGSYSSLGGQSSCTLCAPGTYNPDSGSNASCNPCRGGSYSPSSGAATCITCPVGSYCIAGATSNTVCSSVAFCPRTGLSRPLSKSATSSPSATPSPTMSESNTVSTTISLVATATVPLLIEADMYQKGTVASSIAAGGLAAAALVAFAVHTLVSTTSTLTAAAPAAAAAL